MCIQSLTVHDGIRHLESCHPYYVQPVSVHDGIRHLEMHSIFTHCIFQFMTAYVILEKRNRAYNKHQQANLEKLSVGAQAGVQ